MASLTAQQVSAKWQRNTSAATESYKQGVMSVTEAPSEVAIRNKQRYLDGVMRAYNEGRYEAGLRNITLQSWQQSAITKGVPRISVGVTTAAPKVTAFMERWIPYEQELSRRVKAMPKGSIVDSQARAAFAIEYNSQFRSRVA
jgi:hypothetical protein